MITVLLSIPGIVLVFIGGRKHAVAVRKAKRRKAIAIALIGAFAIGLAQIAPPHPDLKKPAFAPVREQENSSDK